MVTVLTTKEDNLRSTLFKWDNLIAFVFILEYTILVRIIVSLKFGLIIIIIISVKEVLILYFLPI